MPFGLACAPATFELLMEKVMAGFQLSICSVYLDDIIVIGRSFEEMLDNLEQVLNRLKEVGLKLKPKKCQLFAKTVNFWTRNCQHAFEILKSKLIEASILCHLDFGKPLF